MKLNKKKRLIEKEKTKKKNKAKHYSNKQCFARKDTIKSPYEIAII